MIAAYDVKTNRKVRVFVSSTFADMQMERDIIVNSVFPRLRKEFGERLVDVTEVDLRWGIPEEAEDDQILEICIDEVLHCAPFFVGIMGSRYGSIASASAISRLPQQLRSALGTTIPRGASITELEMRAGVFVPGNIDFSCFFVREDALRRKNVPLGVRRLVKTVSKKYETHTYVTMSEFENVLFNRLRDFIDRVFPDRISPPYGDEHYFAHLKILKGEDGRYQPNKSFIDSLERIINEERCVYLAGEKGIGKSACISRLAKREGIERDGLVFFHYAAAGGQSAKLEYVFYRLRLFLENVFRVKSEAPNPHDAVVELLSSDCVDRRVVLFVDALDVLDDLAAAYKFSAIAGMNSNVHVVCSGVEIPRTTSGIHVVRLRKLSQNQISHIVSATLASYGKKLGTKSSSALLRKKECANPLFLKAVLLLLVMRGRHEVFDVLFASLLKAKDAGSLFSIAIKGIKDYFSERQVDPGSVDIAIALMVYSNKGVSESELQKIMGVLPVARSVFLLSLALFTIEDDGLIRFNHDLIVRAAKNLLRRSGEDWMERVASMLIRYFNGQPPGRRKFSEMSFQLYKAGRTNGLLKQISSLECLGYLARFEPDALIGYLSSLTDRQEAIIKRLFPKLHGEERILVAELLCRAGCHRAAISALEAPLESEKDPGTRIRMLDVVSRSLYKLGDNHFRSAIQSYRKLMGYIEKIRPEDSVGWASRAYLLGVTYKSAGRFEEAFLLFEKSKEIYRRCGVRSATSVWVMDVYGVACYAMGRIGAAVKAIRRAVSDSRYLFGQVSAELAWAYCYGWAIYYAAGSIRCSLKMVGDAYQIYDRLYLGHGPMFAWAAINAGTAAMIQNRVQSAEDCYLFSIRENDQVLPIDRRPHVYSLTAYANLACLYEKTGRHGLAVETARFALSQSRMKNGIRHVYTANILLVSGIICRDVVSIRKAVSIYERQKQWTPDYIFSLVCLSRLLINCGRREESKEVASLCQNEYLSKKREIPLLSYLVRETCEANSLFVPVDESKAARKRLVFSAYEFFISHGNNSQAILIPKIGG